MTWFSFHWPSRIKGLAAHLFPSLLFLTRTQGSDRCRGTSPHGDLLAAGLRPGSPHTSDKSFNLNGWSWKFSWNSFRKCEPKTMQKYFFYSRKPMQYTKAFFIILICPRILIRMTNSICTILPSLMKYGHTLCGL